jgi:hypothetical protein
MNKLIEEGYETNCDAMGEYFGCMLLHLIGERDSSLSRGGEAWHFFFVRSLVRWFCVKYEEED